MPTYRYKCHSCETEKDVTHSMSECDNPSEELIEKTSCGPETCPHSPKHNSETDVGEMCKERFKRVPQMFGSPVDLLINNKSKRDKFQKERRKRASKHFEQEVLPGLGPSERKHFIKKRGFKS